MAIVFAITTVICGIGWLCRYVSTLALIYYIEKNGYKIPSDSEIRECTDWAVRKLMKK